MLLTRAPLYSSRRTFTYDLHVLGTPPAFNLSQNQTLQLKVFDSEKHSFSNRTQSSIFPNSLFTCQRTAAAHQRRRCFMHHLLLPVNNFFSKFFQEGVSAPCSSLPRGAFSEPLCLSATSVYAEDGPTCQTLFSSFLEKVFSSFVTF